MTNDQYHLLVFWIFISGAMPKWMRYVFAFGFMFSYKLWFKTI